MFEFARHSDDPGIRSLDATRLASGGVIDTPALRYRIRWCGWVEWLAFALVCAVVYGALVAT